MSGPEASRGHVPNFENFVAQIWCNQNLLNEKTLICKHCLSTFFLAFVCFGTKCSHTLAIKLLSVIHYESVGYPEPDYDVIIDESLNMLRRDL